MEVAATGSPGLPRLRPTMHHHRRPVDVPCITCLCREAIPDTYRWYERPLALILLRPYRCRHCAVRFLGFIRPG